MNIDKIKNELPDFAKDIKLNLSMVLSPEGALGLDIKQIACIALASAYATRNFEVITAISSFASELLAKEEIAAIKAATTIMSMNNIYYRFTHVIENQQYHALPAKLRMNIMANPGIDKIIFELSSLAVSAINGCGKCMNAHVLQLEKSDVNQLAIQSSIRIASVIHATAVAREIA